MEYRIDHDHIDVADIMDQVKKKAAERHPEPEAPAGPAVPSAAPAAPAAHPAPPPAAPPSRGWRGLLKRALRFLLRPYRSFLIPLDEWFRFRTNLPVLLKVEDVRTDLQKAREESAAGIDKAHVRLGTTDGKVFLTQETVKLLHNLAHNLVVEVTKLKVEEEALKSKVRVLEKELETLGKREKAIEKKVFE